ncbi:response regulator [uncultured Amphritea sp.]|uniref:response regulator n=1 Tax=uncultured Amphritea sp. TaxID=981605 RepID=UPI002634F924|nr:response regulator [uncultured Amphritea sp.]
MSAPVPIVICDDSRLARKQMASALQGWNVDITFAELGQQALDAVRAQKGDILFLDLNMPIMDGYQVLEEIRRDDLPTMVIVVSGDVQPEARKRVLKLGALEFIKKPCSAEIIADVLHKYGLLTELEHPDSDIHSEEVIELPDYYQEISNVAMGQAGAMLASLLDTFVDLPIPKVSLVSPAETEGLLLAAVNSGFNLVSQGFVGPELAGEAILVIKHSNLETIASLMDMQGQGDQLEAELEMFLSNVLIGAFLSSFSKQLDIALSRATPIILRNFSGMTEQNSQWQKTLMISINYQLKSQGFHCELLVIFTADSLPKLQEMARYFS